MLRRKVILIPLLVIILALAGGSFVVFGQPSNPLQGKEVVKVQRGDIELTVSGSGTVMPVADTTLTFQGSGIVESVNVKRGDLVHKGDVLVTLDSRELQSQVEQAQAQLESAQASYKKAAEGASQAEIAAAQANVATAVSQLNDVQTDNLTPQDVQSAEAALQSAKAALQSAQATRQSAQAKLDQVKKPATPESITQAQAKVTAAESNLTEVRNSMSAAKEQARIAWEQSGNAVRNAQVALGQATLDYENARDNKTDPSTGRPIDDDQVQKYKNIMDQAILAEQNARDDMTRLGISYENAKQQEITAIQSAEAQLSDAKATLQALQRGPTDEDIRQAQAGVDQAQGGVDQAQAGVDQAQANLDKLRRGPDATTLAAAEAGAAQAQTALEEVMAGPKVTDLEVAMAAVKQAEAGLKLAQIRLDTAKLVAPFDGMVALVGVDPGETVGPTSEVIQIVDNSQLHIDASIAEADIADITMGQKVTVVLDGLPDEELTGVVDFISPNSRTEQNVVIYTVSVRLENRLDQVKAGMSGTVNVLTLSKQGVLVVPNRALKLEKGKQVVQKQEKGKIIFVPVQIGISNEMDSEVLSGLKEGEEILMDTTVERNPINFSG